MAENGHEIEGHMTVAAQAAILEADLYAAKLEQIAASTDDEALAALCTHMAGHVSKTGTLAELTINTQMQLVAYLKHIFERIDNRIGALETGTPEAKSKFRQMLEATFQWPAPKLPKWPEWSMPRLWDVRGADALRKELEDTKGLVAKLGGQLQNDSDALLALENRLDVLYRWELEEIGAPPSVIPESPRLLEITMALNAAAAARLECDKVRDQS